MAEMFVSAIVQLQKTSIFLAEDGLRTTRRTKRTEPQVGSDMAASIATRHHGARSLPRELHQWLISVKSRIEAWALYRRTLHELSDMSGRELADLGLHRSEIRRVAFDSVYGARR